MIWLYAKNHANMITNFVHSYNIFMSLWNFRPNSMKITSMHYSSYMQWLMIGYQSPCREVSYSSYGYHSRYPFTTCHAKMIFWMTFRGQLVIYPIHDLDQILSHPWHYAWLSLAIYKIIQRITCVRKDYHTSLFLWRYKISWGLLIHKNLCILC